MSNGLLDIWTMHIDAVKVLTQAFNNGTEKKRA